MECLLTHFLNATTDLIQNNFHIMKKDIYKEIDNIIIKGKTYKVFFNTKDGISYFLKKGVFLKVDPTMAGTLQSIKRR